MTFDLYNKLVNHRRKSHVKKSHLCLVCHKGFRDKYQLQIHSISHTKEKLYTCDLCDAAFKYKNKFEYHRKCHENPDQKFVCPICGKVYNQFGKAALTSHLRKHKNATIKCKQCGENVTERDYNRHRQLHECKSLFTCHICNKVFKYKNGYNRHIEKHNGVKYLCSFCGKEVASSVSLRDHLRIHTGEKPYSCTFCDKKFSTSSYLKQHLRIHTNERPYVCDFCHKAFNQRGPLRIHIRAVHTKETPYKCEICNETFVSRTVLNMHRKVHIQI